jgi:tetraacyldisaccharide 4'-kinase
VWIGPDRAAAASEAVAQGANCLVLDDGFQRRWQLARNLDLLLVDFGQVQAGEALLPAGPFREPWSQAALADAVLVSGAPKGMDAKALRAALPGAWTQGAVFRLDRRPTGLQTWPGGGRLPLALLRKAPVLALSGLGQPRHFEDTLRDLGAQVRPWRFPDHHRFSLAELQAPPGDAGLVVTTVKDAVRLPASWKPRARVCVLQAEALVTPAAPFWRLVDAALKGGTAQRT